MVAWYSLTAVKQIGAYSCSSGIYFQSIGQSYPRAVYTVMYELYIKVHTVFYTQMLAPTAANYSMYTEWV